MTAVQSHAVTAGRRAVIALALTLAAAHPAAAQSTFDIDAAVAIPAVLVLGAAPPAALSDVVSLATTTRPRRLLTLPALQVSFAALEVLDVISTVRGINSGMVETNVLMRGVAGNPFALAAVKGGAAAATLLLTRRLARKNRPAAVLTMVALNAAYSIVVAQNLAAHRR